jgi:hypothetical protein
VCLKGKREIEKDREDKRKNGFFNHCTITKIKIILIVYEMKSFVGKGVENQTFAAVLNRKINSPIERHIKKICSMKHHMK